MHFGNASNAFLHQMHLMLPLHFVYKMLESGKMHFGCAKMHLMRCQNAFWHQMHFGNASHFPKENVQLCKNAFLHHIFQRKMFSKTKCYKCIFATRTFSKGKCSATLCKNAFLHHILLCKMFSITFYKGKCDANQNTVYFSEVSEKIIFRTSYKNLYKEDPKPM